MDRSQLADFLRRRREALQPEDVGLGRGPRRRANGLRREEVAALCVMSVDYWSRLEQARGPQPSVQMLTAIARGLRLTHSERDHLFLLAGHNAPARHADLHARHVAPGLMRVLDRLQDTPAQIMTDLGETLVQTPPARALFGDETRFAGMARSVTHRWFTDPDARRVYPTEDHDLHSRAFTADLRAASVRQGAGSRAAAVAADLLTTSEEFARLWSAHEVPGVHQYEKRVQHPDTGVMTVQCQLLADLDQNQALLVLTATPGTDSYDRLQLLGVLGQDVTAPR
ncbi:helix-turn-helix domain-containing protein [Nakamurella flavida]|uniref:Helix-turn-helix domain-containing protein n=1 Tax=Nakamurella flavida TaxID=363630 RepID=A0A938YML6_9ACTN|nr:helix-turn-helix transcriptional regulator [Nakamurella flavida]MBM9477483.1 helix-turn-helix domain-containing protein [Nakamurella flavida]MDP9777416.1 transcriptional regulator with XRE-family HTH domain [Nakamurella flavida]